MQTLKDMLQGNIVAQEPQAPRYEPRKLKDWQKIMGVIGSGLTALGGGRPTFARNLMEERQQAEALQQQWDLAESEGRRRMAEKQWERNNPAPTAEMRNFEWYKNAPAEDRALFDQYDPVTVSTWQGPVVVSRSSLARPEIGSIVPDPRKGGQSNQPQMSAQGVPGGVTYITPEQYQANVAALGKERADAHMLRNNIRIGGQ